MTVFLRIILGGAVKDKFQVSPDQMTEVVFYAVLCGRRGTKPTMRKDW